MSGVTRSPGEQSMAVATPAMDALVGLRRRVAQEQQQGATTTAVGGSTSIVQRVRRRNELLDEQIRRNSLGPTTTTNTNIGAPHHSSSSEGRLPYIPKPAPSLAGSMLQPANGSSSHLGIPGASSSTSTVAHGVSASTGHSSSKDLLLRNAEANSTSQTPATTCTTPSSIPRHLGGAQGDTSAAVTKPPASNVDVGNVPPPSTQPSNVSGSGGQPPRGAAALVAQVAPTPPTAPKPAATAPLGATTASGRVVDERKLAEWRRKPLNTSPFVDRDRSSIQRPLLLPTAAEHLKDRKTLVLDIDETLVHASFTPAKPFNVRLLVEVEGERGFIYVAFRPHLNRFLNEVASLFEVVVFTASQRCYADQLMDAIDPGNRLGRLRLFREHCTEITNARVKDLTFIGRPLDRVAIVDNSPVAYLFQPRNAVPIESWFDDPHDTALLKLMPMLRDLAKCNSVYDVLDPFNCSL